MDHLLYTRLQDFHLPCCGNNINSPGNAPVHIVIVILPETVFPCSGHWSLFDFRGLMGFTGKYNPVRRPRCLLIFPKEFLGSPPTGVHM